MTKSKFKKTVLFHRIENKLFPHTNRATLLHTSHFIAYIDTFITQLYCQPVDH